MDSKTTKITEWLHTERECYVCGETYTNASACGMRQCTEHYGRISNGEFTCCKTKAPLNVYSLSAVYQLKGYIPPQVLGCIRADHNEKKGQYEPYSKTDKEDGEGNLTIPLSIYNMLDFSHTVKERTEYLIELQRYEVPATKKQFLLE